jgi:hypothetical protein
MAPATLEPERGNGELEVDTDARSGAESVVTMEASDIEKSLQTTLLRRAQKIKLQHRLEELKAKGEDSAAIENAERALSEIDKEVQKLYEDGALQFFSRSRLFVLTR